MFRSWTNYFDQNQTHFDHIGFDSKPTLTATERALITSSIQQFQRGEYSEGKHLLSKARTYFHNSSDQSYMETLPFFIREEQDHALILRKFMLAEDIPTIKDHWVDHIFRLLRKYASLEYVLIILLTAELVAMVYYEALRKATGSSTLKAICKQILADEIAHIRFQCYTLAYLRDQNSLVSKSISRAFQHLLMMGTTWAVWYEHRKVLRAGGYNFGRFNRGLQAELRNALYFIDKKQSVNSIPSLKTA